MGLSLRLLLSVMIALMTILSALVAFLPTYLSGVASVKEGMDDLRGANRQGATNELQAFVDRGQKHVESIYEFHRAKMHNNNPTMDEIAQFTGRIARENTDYFAQIIYGAADGRVIVFDSRYGGGILFHIRWNHHPFIPGFGQWTSANISINSTDFALPPYDPFNFSAPLGFFRMFMLSPAVGNVSWGEVALFYDNIALNMRANLEMP